MITNALSLAEVQCRSVGGLVTLVVVVVLVSLIIICLYRAAEFFGSATKEQKLLRIEMGKLADELEQLRKKAQGEDKGKSSDESA